MTKAEQAIELHKSGSTCSQSVFTVFARDFGLDAETAHALSNGLGGGLGRLGLTCGAITGGALALSLAFGSKTSADQAAKMDAYKKVEEYVTAMQKRFGAVQCRDLLGGLDLRKEEDRLAMKEKALSDKVCNNLIRACAEYVETAIKGSDRSANNG